METSRKMPIKNIEESQRQNRLMMDKLSEELNPKNKLYKLRSIIDWKKLEGYILTKQKVQAKGRERHSVRVMVGLLLLQAMKNTSDALTAEELTENVYWQYFCGYEYVEKEISVSESSIRRFRQMLGEEGLNEVMKELVRVGEKVGVIKKKDIITTIVDTTVQQKNIKHPHDVHLMEKARIEIVKLCRNMGIKLNETYAKRFKKDMLKLWRYKKDSKAKKRWKIMKKLKTLLGRLIRLCERNIVGMELTAQQIEILCKAKKIHAQSILKANEKAKYKKDNKILYSFHAEEVECIGKGKLHKPYEFGNKVSITVSSQGNFVLSAKAFHGNPYDGHTLSQSIDSAEELTGDTVEKVFVDRGYKGNNMSAKSKIFTPDTKKKLTTYDKKMMKRRSAIEPIIGHLKQFGRMGKNYLKGVIGDIMNPIISSIGLNMRNICCKLLASP